MVDLVVGVLAIVGAAFVALAGIGVVRFGDLYARMHAATKASALGVGVVGSAAAIAVGEGRGKILLAVVFILVTTPASSHFIGRAAYRAEGIDVPLDGPDDLRSIVDDVGSDEAG